MKKNLATFALLVLSSAPLGSLSAFELSNSYWTTGTAEYRVGIPGISPSGVAYVDAFKQALAEWTAETSFNFTSIDEYQNPCTKVGENAIGDNLSGVDFGGNICGEEFGSSTIAIALRSGVCFESDNCAAGFDIKEADIIFNNSVAWDVYDGPIRFDNTVDFRRVALHELGHAIGLEHEEDVPSIMAANTGDLDVLQFDDIAAAITIYGGELPQEFTSYQSRYGIRVRLPSNSVVSDASSSFSISGELNSSDGSVGGAFIDLHQITVKNDSRIVASLASSSFNSFLYLARIDATQGLISAFTDTNSGPQGAARIEQNVQAGTYWIGVSSDNIAEVGTYELDIQTTRNSLDRTFETFVSVAGIPVEINPNPTIEGNLESTDFVFEGSFMDVYQISITEQSQVNFALESEEFNTRLYLARILPGEQLDGSFIFFTIDRQNSLNSSLDITLSPGTYWLAPTSTAAGASGSYTITTTTRI